MTKQFILSCALGVCAWAAAGAAGAADGSAAPYTKPDEATLRKMLTPEQYEVTQNAGTERPFHNAYWNHKEAGIYVDVTTGKPLFSSLDKYDSGTGWPSFSKPIDTDAITTRSDNRHSEWLGERTEVRSSGGDAHLGHVFSDGPASGGGQRFCMNSAALRFVPVASLDAQGYGQYLRLFKSETKSETAKAKSVILKASNKPATQRVKVPMKK